MRKIRDYKKKKEHEQRKPQGINKEQRTVKSGWILCYVKESDGKYKRLVGY